ncbi:PREDICTED: probable nucleoside diphosphate kinase 5 isoform X2 [Lupinus angustifolius]|uniref:probable nucleoside diphosphate kinase 5 isoform X2 n=1 Tax=Lupinus angustifolius TaxID=3871 RepID=UPI00092F0751|nr:PREDICTED: probable nucleoside diphosphate kinase 5 isoform X2 [Lupinus angustifolius]
MRFPFVGFITILVLVVFASQSCSSTHGNIEKEKTLAIIKPDGLLGNYTDDIKRTILEYGFRIFKEKTVQFDEATLKRFYAEHSSKSFFSSLTKYMTSGPVLVMVLEKDNAIADWRALMGPTDSSKAKITHPHSVRAMCGLDTQKNCVHGSDSTKSAEREISFFFRELSADIITEHDEL